MVPLCASRLAAAAVVAAAVVAAVVVTAASRTVAVAAPRVPTDGRLTKRQFISSPEYEAEAVDVHDDESLKCLPSLAPTCNLEEHMELALIRKCLPQGYSAAARAARVKFSRIESMVAAAHPVSNFACCYDRTTIENIRMALVGLAPAIHCSTGQSSTPPALPDALDDVLPDGLGSTWGSVVIPGDDRLWCCDSQNYAPEDPSNRPCCVDGCYEIADTLGWLGYTIDSCCALLSNREQYGRVCPPGTINKSLVP